MNKKIALFFILLTVFFLHKLSNKLKEIPVPERYSEIEFVAPTPEQPFLMSYQEENAYHQLYGRSFLDLLWAEEYDILDGTINRFRRNQERGVGGDWKLNTVYRRIANFEHSQEHLDNFYRKILNWIHARPNSFNAKLLMAKYWHLAAWQARGGGYASTVSAKGWEEFDVRLKKSEEILQDIAKEGKSCPYYYDLLIRVSQDLHGVEATMKLWEESVRRFPDYLYFHKSIAFHLLPRWCGSDEQVIQFANEVCDRLGGDQGYIAYIYIVKRIYRKTDADTFFERFSFDWTRIKKGYEARERLYGRSHSISVVYLQLAASKGDLEVVESLLELFEKNWTEDDWEKEKSAFSIRKQYGQTEQQG